MIEAKQFKIGKTVSARKTVTQQLRLRNSFERRLVPQLLNWFSFTGKEAIKSFENTGDIQLVESRDKLDKILSTHYFTVIKEFASNFNFIQKKEEDRFSYFYRQYMNEQGGSKITNMTRTQQRDIIKRIKGFDGVDAIGKEIRKTTSPNVTRYRAVLIARTETHSASNFANHQVASEYKIPMVKRWVATNDGRTRSFHSALNNTEVGMDEDFTVFVNGIEYKMGYAGDPRGGAVNTINCRCVVLYVEPEDVIVEPTVQTTQPEVTEPISLVDIGILLNRGSKNTRKQYNEEFNSQLTEQQKEIVDKIRKPQVIKNTQKGVYYARTMTMQAKLGAKDGPVKSKVIAHEYGHHVDYQLAGSNRFRESWSATNADFKYAIDDDIRLHGFHPHGVYSAQLGKATPKQLKTREEFMEKWSEKLSYKNERDRVTLRGDGFGEVSDIIDAMTGGLFYKNYRMWGHGVSYFRDRGAREAEIFANLFSLKNDPKAYNLVKEIIPNTVIQFEKKLDEVQKRLSNVPRGGIVE